MSVVDSPVKRLHRLRSFSISTPSWTPVPPVPRLLRSNEPPNPTEYLAIKRAIDDAKAKLEAVSPGSRVSGAGLGVFKMDRSPSKAFEHRRVALLQFIASHKAILSPFRTLPSELLILIFEEYMRDWENADIARTQCPPPWIFTGVCRFWRMLALDTPTLWKALPPFRIDVGGEGVEAQFRRLVMQVDRAKGVPLTVKIVSQHGASTPTAKTLNRLHWFASFAERWKDLSLRIEQDDLNFLSTIRGRLSSLRRLHLAVSSPQVPHRLAQAFAEAPCLEEIHIEGYCPPNWITFPSRLRVFSGHLCSTELILRILHVTPHLEKCVLHVKDSPNKTTGNVPPLTLNKLRQLYISVDKENDPFTLNSFFDKVTLPALESLHIRISSLNRHSNYSLIPLTKFLGRSSPTGMRELTLRCHSQHKGAFLDILKTTPGLVSLSIKGAHISDLEYLIFRPNSSKSNILPQLRRLCIDADYDIPPFTLGNIAHSRTSSSSSIQNRQRNSSSLRCARLEFLCVGLLYDNYIESLMSNWERWSPETRDEASSLQTLAVDICHAHEAMVQHNKTLSFQKLEHRFGQLDECKITDPSLLEFAFIPDVLECISKGPSDYRLRAKKILDRWQPALESRRQTYQWHRYWTFNRDYPILAVYHSGPRRTAPSKSLPYNIARDEPFSACFFPQEVTSDYWASF